MDNEQYDRGDALKYAAGERAIILLNALLRDGQLGPHEALAREIVAQNEAGQQLCRAAIYEGKVA